MIADALTGDLPAVAVLLNAVRQTVEPYCRRRLAGLGPAAVEQVLHEIGMDVLADLPSIRDEPAVRPRLFTIARGAIGRRVPHPAQPEPARTDRTSRLMEQLPERERDALALRLIGGLNAEETGAVLGLTGGAVRMSQHRALRTLRALLADQA